DRQALAFEAGDDLTGEPAGERVGLDQDQGSFNSHGASVWQRSPHDAATSGVAATPGGRLAGSRFGGLGLCDLGRDRRLVGRLTATAARRGRRRGAGLGLAERADAPRRVDRLRAGVAALLELAHARWTAQVVR